MKVIKINKKSHKKIVNNKKTEIKNGKIKIN